MIEKHFENIVGQEIAKARLIQSARSAANGGEMLSPLVMAEAGVGKTRICNAYCGALEGVGIRGLRFSSPEEFRENGTQFAELMELLSSGERYFLFIDEIHLIENRKTVQLEKVRAFLMKALDKENAGREIRLSEDLVVSFRRDRASIVLATNFPEKLDKSGAFQSRCDRLNLGLYSEDELVQILQVMLAKEHFRPANDDTLRMIARCGRGTARPMDKIISELKVAISASGSGKNSINRDDVIHALRLAQMFPRGLSAMEVRLLKRCEGAPMPDRNIFACMPDMETPTLRRAKGYLIGECGFAFEGSKGMQTTDKGKRYLEEIRKAGFDA